MDSITYNGWKNYETWNVHLWLTNDCGTHDCWRGAAKECREADNTSTVWTAEEAARFMLADRLKDEIEEGDPLLDDASLYHDLLGAAINEVDWVEIADAFLKEGS